MECCNWEGDHFKITNPDGITRLFKPSAKGLCYWDSTNATRERKEANLLETIADNKENFSARDVARAEAAWKLQHVAGHMTDAQLLKMTRNNILLNCPFTPRDIKLMKAILGPSMPGMKGKTARDKK